jgi:ATP/maltotriose-dependent transcriptional regulator MalT
MHRAPPTTGAAGPPVDPAPRLSEREHEMLGLLAAGRSMRQIAAAMSISTNTVRGHGRKLLVKFGVAQREEAVRRAREVGVL